MGVLARWVDKKSAARRMAVLAHRRKVELAAGLTAMLARWCDFELASELTAVLAHRGNLELAAELVARWRDNKSVTAWTAMLTLVACWLDKELAGGGWRCLLAGSTKIQRRGGWRCSLLLTDARSSQRRG